MKSARRFWLVVILASLVTALGLCACGSTPAKEAAEALRDANAIRSGDAKSSLEESIPQTGLAASYLGNATQAQVHAKAQRQVQSTAAGPVQLAFQLSGGTKEQLEFAQAMVRDDPVLASIGAQIKALTDVYVKTPTPDLEARLKSARDEASARLTLLTQVNVPGSLSMAKLTTLVVFNSIAGYSVGDELKPLGENETKAMEAGFSSLWTQLGPVLAGVK